jgi:polyribonucleotide nucleotidyltransferase
MHIRESVMVGGRPLTIETGRLAKQAEAAVLVTYGETSVLVTLCYSEPRAGMDFFPLTCDYVEKTYAAGKIPGGFFKREARQREAEILTCRIMDRPVRPLFPKGFKMDTQLIATVVSHDGENEGDVLALTGASACIHCSALPWDGPIVGIRVGRVDGKFVANPTLTELAESDISILVACSREAIVMVEGGAKEMSENDLADALDFALEASQPIIDLIEELRAVVGKAKLAFEAEELDESLKKRVAMMVDKEIETAAVIKEKHARYGAYDESKKRMMAGLAEELAPEVFAANEKLLKNEFGERKYEVVREMVLGTKKRIDGRSYSDIRRIDTMPGYLARTHGSALFQRGETQALATTTLGTRSAEQKIDGLTGEVWKRFYLHYNFPPFCVGETKFLRGPGRREIGHGALAERALEAVVPSKDDFPYVIRIVSETLESNGSSSMAAVCGGCMSMMDAGVPIKAPVAGIAMGLISDGKRHAVLSDILGDEDHLGDMDFKVCGTDKGITAIQMDIKIKGLSRDLMLEALNQAREGRKHILKEMLKSLPASRPELSKHAPRIHTIKVKPEQIRIIIGPGGKTIKGIVDQTGVSIDVEDDGTVNVASADGEALRKALEIIEGLTTEPEVGKIYDGVVRRIADFGCFVEILPNWDGLVHISELAWGRTDRVEDVCKEGDPLRVKVLSVDGDGKVRLSHKDTTDMPEGYEPPPPRERGGDRDRGGDRGGRGGPGGGRGRDRDRGGRSGGGGRGGDRGRGRGDRDRGPRRDDGDAPREERAPQEERAPREERAPQGDERPSGGDGGDDRPRRRRRATTATAPEDGGDTASRSESDDAPRRRR